MSPAPAVALSGPDNVGKSTQLRILGRRLHPRSHPAGSLHDHDARWTTIVARGTATWWFTTATTTELTDVLAASYLARHAATSDDSIRLIDRGVPMLEASLAATLSVRLDLNDDDGHREALRLLTPYRDDLHICEDEERGIVLLHSTNARDGAARSLAREARVSDTYRRYQFNLTRQILRLVDERRFAHTIVVGDRCVMDVQDELRAALYELNIPAPPGLLSRARVVAFGGMSESGKSTAADWLRRKHGYTRLKIGYLLAQAAAHHAIPDVYGLDETLQAELLVDSLDRYLAAHYYGQQITIESLHRYKATEALRTLL